MLRSAIEKDIDAVVAIEKQTLRESWGKEGYLSHLRGEGYFTVYMKDSHIIGFCVASGVLDQWELYKIAVTPQMQRQGVAQELLRDLEKRCMGTLFLEVRESNQRAQEFYKQRGFRKIGVREAYYRDGESAYLYQKQLS